MANIYVTLYTMDLSGFQMLTFTLHNSIITLFMEGDFEESKVACPSHTNIKWYSWESRPGSLALEPPPNH